MSEEMVQKLRERFEALKVEDARDRERQAAGLGPLPQAEESDLAKVERPGWAVFVEGRENGKITQLDATSGHLFHEAVLERNRLEAVYERDGYRKGVWAMSLPGTTKQVLVSVKWLGEKGQSSP